MPQSHRALKALTAFSYRRPGRPHLLRNSGSSLVEKALKTTKLDALGNGLAVGRGGTGQRADGADILNDIAQVEPLSPPFGGEIAVPGMDIAPRPAALAISSRRSRNRVQ